MALTPSKMLALDLEEFEVSPDDDENESTTDQRLQTASYPRTPTRLTRYDPYAFVDSPNTPIRPFSEPIWPVHSLGSPIEPSGLVDLEFDRFDWDALESIVKLFDESELPTFNSIYYRQILNQLSLKNRSKWLELLLHLGVQDETLWVDRLHKFKEDYMAKEAKKAEKRKISLWIQRIEIGSKNIWFQRWYNAGILKVQLDQFLKAPVARTFKCWREKTQLLRDKLVQIDNVFQNARRARLVVRWRDRSKQVRDLDTKSLNFDRDRLIRIGVRALKTSISNRLYASREFEIEHSRKVFAIWRQRLREEQSKKRFEYSQKSIYLQSWFSKLELFRSQLEKADRYQKSHVVRWYHLWEAKLEKKNILYASGVVLFESNFKAAVFGQWRRNAKLFSRGVPFLFYSQQQAKQRIFYHWRLLTGIQREVYRFRKFFIAQNALKVWRLEARYRILKSKCNKTLCRQTFRHWRMSMRLKTLQKDKKLQDLHQLFDFLREEAQNIERREHALDLRARLLRKKFEFATFWRLIQLKYTERQEESLAAEKYYNTRLQTTMFNKLSKLAVIRIESEANAGDLALAKLKHKYFDVWNRSFKQVRDEQFKQLEIYATTTYAMKFMKLVFSHWQKKVQQVSKAEQFSDLILCERYFYMWLGKLASRQEQLARAGDWYIESSRVSVFGRWRDHLDQVRQNDLELELLQEGRAIEKAAIIFEQWRAATMLVKDKDPLLARRREWFAQQQTRRIFRKWRRTTERTQPSPQTPLRSEALLQRSTVSRMLSQRRPIGRVQSTGSPISRKTADNLI